MTILYTNPEYKTLFETLQKQGFKRNQFFTGRYSELLEELKEKNINVNDYTREKYFKGDERIVIASNLYPYSLPDGFRHDILWMLDNLPSKEINEAVNAFYEAETVVACFINEITKQSITSIRHAHIIIDTLC